MLNSKLTPLLRQYLEVKENYKDCLIFFRLGDFYELFFEDAQLAAKCLDITLTKRGQVDGNDIPMCGVPHHHGDNYIAKLLKNGFKVAICEQIETPEESKKRGQKEIIKRKVVRIATPGTLTEEKELLTSDNNYLMNISFFNDFYNLVVIDISTGEINLKKCILEKEVLDYIADIMPSEIIVPKNKIYNFISDNKKKVLTITKLEELSKYDQAKQTLTESYVSNSNFKISNFSKNDIISLGTTINYVAYTQNGKLPALSIPNNKENNDYLEIDSASKRNLEIIKTLNGDSEGSLFSSLNFTHTSPGSRLLLNDLANPLKSVKKIKQRLELVNFFNDNYELLQGKIIKYISQFPDIARSLNRLSLGRGGPRDLSSICLGLEKAKALYDYIEDSKAKNPFKVFSYLINKNKEVLKVINILKESLAESLPTSSRDGNFIKKGINLELDKIRAYRDNIKKLILEEEVKERKITGINTLKIKYNSFLGYFLDVSAVNNSKIKKIENNYIHRQTLKNSYRYTTKTLVEISENILSANFKVQEIENSIYANLLKDTLLISDKILEIANLIARIDVSFSWAVYARKYDAVNPEVNNSNDFEIINGRHPAVEKTHTNNFISNSCVLNKKKINTFKLITGPNMSGKSTFLRQNALILIMAQAGGFCPAKKVKIGICDKLFCRVGSGDELAKGNSTFMVEMIETANILNSATESSLVVLDEIGRGTSTYDGMSLAWATIEHLIEKIKCKTLFATHYNELCQLDQKHNQLELSTFRVKEWESDLIFLHQLVPGVAKSSYGIQVAKMAGVPKEVIVSAHKMLIKLEKNNNNVTQKTQAQTLIKFEEEEKNYLFKNIVNDVNQINLNQMTPLEALNFLKEVQEKLKGKN